MSTKLESEATPAMNDDRRLDVSWGGYFVVLMAVVACTAVSAALHNWLSLTDLAMIFLLAVVIIAAYCRLALSIIGAVLCFISFDFFFVPPVYTLRFANGEHLITGIVLLVVGVITSVLSSRVRKSLELANQAALVANEERLRNSVLASLSHDLRTPLSVIAGSASSLRENRSRLSEAEQDQLLETIFQQSRTMSMDVSDLLEMTRLDAGPVKLNKEWYPLEELIGAALERSKATTTGRHITVEVPSDTPMVYVDGVLLEKLLVNLIENAAKYTLPGSSIGIIVKHSTHSIDIVVEDDGPGLPQAFEPQLFKKFARAQAEGTVSGSGLGLSICKAIAHLHDATLVGRNRPLGGAQFELSIPYKQPPSQQEETT